MMYVSTSILMAQFFIAFYNFYPFKAMETCNVPKTITGNV